MRVRPISMTESGGSGAFVSGWPFSFEPFVEPRSFTWPRVPSQRISTCLREVPVSSTVMSASVPRPMMVRALRDRVALAADVEHRGPGDLALHVDRVDAHHAVAEARVALRA